jgi:hypothetical protein
MRDEIGQGLRIRPANRIRLIFLAKARSKSGRGATIRLITGKTTVKTARLSFFGTVWRQN